MVERKCHYLMLKTKSCLHNHYMVTLSLYMVGRKCHYMIYDQVMPA